MATDVNKPAILDAYRNTVAEIDNAVALGQELARQIDRIYLVGCGGPNRVMLTQEYWIEHFCREFEVRRFFPAEFVTQKPRIDKRTLVVLGSKSGTTPETVQAAQFVKDFPCRTIALTETPDLPLAKAVQTTLLTGHSSGAHAAMFMLLQALIGGMMAGREAWELLGPLTSSLRALPQVMAETAEQADRRAADEARLLKDDRILYHVAAGPMFSAAYVFGVCVLMEMQWMHSVALEAAEFFHGPFEIVDQNTPLVLMKGEDPSRPLIERVERFSKKYTKRLFIYDTKDYAMSGVDQRIRPLVGPFVLQAALRRIAEHIAVWHNHPLSTRRYMWKTEY
jgi:fructoselysine 6-phosphate deglycase